MKRPNLKFAVLGIATLVSSIPGCALDGSITSSEPAGDAGALGVARAELTTRNLPGNRRQICDPDKGEFQNLRCPRGFHFLGLVDPPGTQFRNCGGELGNGIICERTPSRENGQTIRVCIAEQQGQPECPAGYARGARLSQTELSGATCGAVGNVFACTGEPTPTPSSFRITPESATLQPRGEAQFRVILSSPAPAGGSEFALSTVPAGSGQLPFAVSIPNGRDRAVFTYTGAASAGTTRIIVDPVVGVSQTAPPQTIEVTVLGQPDPRITGLSSCSPATTNRCARRGCFCTRALFDDPVSVFAEQEVCSGGLCAIDPRGCSDSQRSSCFQSGCGCNAQICAEGSCISYTEFLATALLPVITFSGVLTPILIDVDGDGFDLTSATDGVRFDIRADGEPLRIAWTRASDDDAWLALDRNGNGRIDDGRELFGNFTPQPDSEERNGYSGLAEFDRADLGGNGNGVIDPDDGVYEALMLWQDTDHDGTSDPGELRSLASAGIRALGLDFQDSWRRDAHGNEFRYRGRVYRTADAEVGWLSYDVFLTSVPEPSR